MTKSLVPFHLASLAAVSTVAVLLLVPPASAQQMPPSQPSGQETRSTQTGLPGDIRAVEQARESVDKAQPTQMQQAAEQARQALQGLERSLSQVKDQAGQLGPEAMRSIESAKSALAQPTPVKATVSQALQAVVQDARRIQQQMTQTGTGAQTGQQASGAQIGVQQRAAQVEVQQKAPTVTVQQPPPQVTVQQPKPQVTVEPAKPQVTVQQQGEPKVNIQGTQEHSGQSSRQSSQAASSTSSTPSAATTSDSSSLASLGRGIVGKEIYGTENADIGEVEDVVMQGAQVQSVLVDVGGFLGIGAKRVAIPIDQLRMQGDRIVTSMTRDQVRDLPEHTANR